MSKLDTTKISNEHFDRWIKSADIVRTMKLYLSRKQLDEKQLDFLLQHAFIEGVICGSEIALKAVKQKSEVQNEVS